MNTLMIIVGSVRPGRIGLPIAEWVRNGVTAHGEFEIDFVDLLELNLPLMDEPGHPVQHNYTKQHTIDWGARVDAADAFIFVTPEYNHSYPASLKNALDFLYNEWGRKPVGMVSYGGVSAGTRAVVGLEPVLNELAMVSAKNAVEIPFARTHIVEGVFVPDERVTAALEKVLAELAPLAEGLKSVR